VLKTRKNTLLNHLLITHDPDYFSPAYRVTYWHHPRED